MVVLSEFSCWNCFTSRAGKKITKNQPCARPNQSSIITMQSNQLYLSKIKISKIKAFIFQLPPTFFFFKLNGQNKFIVRSENILKKKCHQRLPHVRGSTLLAQVTVNLQRVIFVTTSNLLNHLNSQHPSTNLKHGL